MKAITLTQPWATLVAIGAKKIETRSWYTGYRGPLAIHAGKGLGPVGGQRGLRTLCGTEPFYRILTEYAQRWLQTDIDDLLNNPPLPRGAIICTVELYDVIPTERIANEINTQEQAFGDYSPGRYAWRLRELNKLDAPIPARGALGLWEWQRWT